MMKSKKSTELRTKLLRREAEITNDLEMHSADLDSKISKNMKTIALVGAGLAIGFVIYKLLSAKKVNTEKKTHINTKPELVKSNVMGELLSGVVKGLLPIVLEKISKNELDEKSIKTTRTK